MSGFTPETRCDGQVDVGRDLREIRGVTVATVVGVLFFPLRCVGALAGALEAVALISAGSDGAAGIAGPACPVPECSVVNGF